MIKFFGSLAGMKNYLSFVLTLISILGIFAAHFVRGTDIEILLPTVLGIYVMNRTASKMSAHLAASRDEKADTGEVIRQVDDK